MNLLICFRYKYLIINCLIKITSLSLNSSIIFINLSFRSFIFNNKPDLADWGNPMMFLS